MFGQECWYFLKSFHKCTLFYKKNKRYLLYTIKKHENIISKIGRVKIDNFKKL